MKGNFGYGLSAYLQPQAVAITNHSKAGGTLFAGALTYRQTRAGTEIDLKLVYTVAAIKGVKLAGLYGIFNPGAAVSERNGRRADVARFAYVTGQYAF